MTFTTPQTKSFLSWFGNSVVRTVNGSPLIVFHGSSNAFNAFFTSEGTLEGAAFFTTCPNLAEGFGESAAQSGAFLDPDWWPVLYPVFLSLQNPMVVDDLNRFMTVDNSGPLHNFSKMKDLIQHAKQTGHDGLWLKDVPDLDTTGDQFAAFHPTQIKSAYNTGAFSLHNQDIAK